MKRLLKGGRVVDPANGKELWHTGGRGLEITSGFNAPCPVTVAGKARLA